MNLSEAGKKFTILTKTGNIYHLHLPEGDFIVLVAGADLGTAGFDFNDDKVAAKTHRVFDLKHYGNNIRGKYWTRRAGVDFYFVFDKKDLELVEKEAYSYPQVKIGGRTYTMSVSGGTDGKTWNDNVRSVAHIGIEHTKASLKHLAKYAINPFASSIMGMRIDIRGISESDQKDFLGMVSAHKARKELKQGDKIFLGYGCNYEGTKGPFIVSSINRRKRTVLADLSVCYTSRVRMKYNQVDWTQTAAANGIELVSIETVNHIGGILEPAY